MHKCLVGLPALVYVNVMQSLIENFMKIPYRLFQKLRVRPIAVRHLIIQISLHVEHLTVSLCMIWSNVHVWSVWSVEWRKH